MVDTISMTTQGGCQEYEDTVVVPRETLAKFVRGTAKRDVEIAEQSDTIAERDATIAEQSDTIAERDATIAEQNDIIAKQSDTIAEKMLQLKN